MSHAERIQEILERAETAPPVRTAVFPAIPVAEAIIVVALKETR